MSARAEVVSFKIFHPGHGVLMSQEEYQATRAKEEAYERDHHEEIMAGMEKAREQKMVQQEAEAKEKKVRVRSSAPVDPEKSGVIGWVRDLIFRDEKISVVKLRGMMEEKGYAPATLNAQMARIKRAYVLVQDFIYLNQDCAVKLAEKR